VPVVYTWYPNAMGFVRNTLRAGRCDLIMGVVAADELVQNTNPYYRSSYVLAYRTADADRFGDLDSPLMRLARIGVVAGTPPVNLLNRKGLLAQVRGYDLMVDTRVEQPPRQMIEDLARGQIDAALVWGPIAGYWAKQQSVPITLVPLTSDPRSGLRLDFRISMGMRPGEPEWKHLVNSLIRELQPQMQAILLDYGVPLLDETPAQCRPRTSRSRRPIAWIGTARAFRRRCPALRSCRRPGCRSCSRRGSRSSSTCKPSSASPKTATRDRPGSSPSARTYQARSGCRTSVLAS
jgi:quinoprotein dehydrogenase-associated probable ABC transporter substrate-binding protein